MSVLQGTNSAGREQNVCSVKNGQILELEVPVVYNLTCCLPVHCVVLLSCLYYTRYGYNFEIGCFKIETSINKRNQNEVCHVDLPFIAIGLPLWCFGVYSCVRGER